MNLGKFWQQLRGQPQSATPDAEPTVAPLSDADCEYLFSQVLEGVAHGWDGARVEKFFDRTRDRADLTHWVTWLQRYSQQVLSAPAPDRELAKRLERLAVVTQHLPGTLEIGAAAYALALRIRDRQETGTVWEYDGPDGVFSTGTPEEPLTTPDRPGVETLTLEELLERLRNDPELRRRIAAQVGIESDDPLVIIQALATKLRPPGG